MKALALALLAATALLGCPPGASTPRQDATPDAQWTQAIPPASFDAGSGSGGY